MRVTKTLSRGCSRKAGAPCLSSYDRNILRDLIKILVPFEEAADFVQTENELIGMTVWCCVDETPRDYK